LKNFEDESYLLYQTLQLLFWAKIHLSYDLHFVFLTFLAFSEIIYERERKVEQLIISCAKIHFLPMTLTRLWFIMILVRCL